MLFWLMLIDSDKFFFWRWNSGEIKYHSSYDNSIYFIYFFFLYTIAIFYFTWIVTFEHDSLDWWNSVFLKTFKCLYLSNKLSDFFRQFFFFRSSMRNYFIQLNVKSIANYFSHQNIFRGYLLLFKGFQSVSTIH